VTDKPNRLDSASEVGITKTLQMESRRYVAPIWWCSVQHSTCFCLIQGGSSRGRRPTGNSWVDVRLRCEKKVKRTLIASRTSVPLLSIMTTQLCTWSWKTSIVLDQSPGSGELVVSDREYIASPWNCINDIGISSERFSEPRHLDLQIALAGGGDEASEEWKGTSWFMNCALPTIVSHDATLL
jgi:hypothetical protein